MAKYKGNNDKPRVGLVFPTEADKNCFRGVAGDLGTSWGTLIPETAVKALVSCTAKTKEGRWVSRQMYSSEHPRCQEAFAITFSNITAIGVGTRDALPLVECFRDYVKEFGMQIDATSDKVVHFHEGWRSVVEVLKQEAQAKGEATLITAAKRADTMSIVFENPSPMQEIISFVTIVIESWQVLHEQDCVFSVLCDLATMCTPYRLGAIETPNTRRKVLSVIDNFYASGEEADV